MKTRKCKIHEYKFHAVQNIQKTLCAIVLFFSVLCSVQVYADSDPIDVVYTWVDGSDIDWQLQKAKYLRMYGKEFSQNDANALNRFRNRAELR